MEVWRSSGDGEAAAAAVCLPVQFVYEPYLSAMSSVAAAAAVCLRILGISIIILIVIIIKTE